MSSYGWRTHAEWWALGVLLTFTLIAVTGFGVFALHPERLPPSSFAIAVFSRSFTLFGRVHIALTIAVLAIALFKYSGGRWALSAALVVALSFLSEHLGTGYGIPFGAYSYSDLLGYKIGGRVPLLIPLSWFVMAAPSYGLAARVFPGSGGRVGRIVGATLLLVSWDLALDPAMSFLTRYWMWGDPGQFFYGMPLVNLLGWTLTGVVLMVAMEFSGALSWTSRVSPRWWAAFYGVVLLMPLGMVLAGGLWGSALATAMALGVLGLLAKRRIPADDIPTPLRANPSSDQGAPASLSTLGGGR